MCTLTCAEWMARRAALLEADELPAVQVALEQTDAALRAEPRRLLGRQAEAPGTADG